MENDHAMKRVLPPNLPYEIVFDILSRLPVKSLCRFKSVSKPWLALITDPQFIQSHLHQSMKSDVNHKVIIAPRYSNSSESFYSLDCLAPVPTVAELDMPYKSEHYFVEIWGSFNGVLLFEIGDELCLWNPSIRKYQKFSHPNYPGCNDVIWYGLGYDSISDDFKVVAAVCPPGCTTLVVHVFSSKLSSWKSIGDFDYSSYLVGKGTVLNGAPHRLLHRCTEIYFHIVCFDVTEEKFKEIPNPIEEVEYDSCTLGVLGGWLCVVNSHPMSRSDVWVMKEYGIKESWTKLFVVPNVRGEFFFDFFDPLCFTKDGEVVIMFKSHDSAKLVIYNADKQTYRRIGIPQDCKKFNVALYVESLVSPHARVLEGAANQMEMGAKMLGNQFAFDDSLGSVDGPNSFDLLSKQKATADETSRQVAIEEAPSKFAMPMKELRQSLAKSSGPAPSMVTVFRGEDVISECQRAYVSTLCTKLTYKIGKQSFDRLNTIEDEAKNLFEELRKVDVIDVSPLERIIESFFKNIRAYNSARSASTEVHKDTCASQLADASQRLSHAELNESEQVKITQLHQCEFETLEAKEAQLKKELESISIKRKEMEELLLTDEEKLSKLRVDVSSLKDEISTIENAATQSDEDTQKLEKMKTYIEASQKELADFKLF